MGLAGNEQEIVKYYQLSLDSTQLLSCRVKDLLDRSLIENNIFTAREVEFSPSELVKQMVHIYETMMQNLNVRFEMIHSP